MVISLEGDLGAGKTTFVQGLLKGFNYKNDVTSPTFTLINEYNADFKVIHIDFYREPNINRWKHLGLHEFMNNHHIILIEWGNLIPELLPEDTIHIFFEHVDNNKRKIAHIHHLFFIYQSIIYIYNNEGC